MNKKILLIGGLIVVVGGVVLLTRNPIVPAPSETANQDTSTPDTGAPVSTTPKPISGLPTGNTLVVSNQKPGPLVTIDKVTLTRSGFVAIHEDNRGTPGKILAYSAVLAKGTHTNVTVSYAMSPSAGYFAMLHADSDDSKAFASGVDQPLNDSAGKPIMQQFYANVSTVATNINYQVSIKSFAFTPATLTVKRGDTVTFINNDSAPHTVTATAFGGAHAMPIGQNYTLDTKNLSAGTYTYHCDYHPSMTGTITVK